MKESGPNSLPHWTRRRFRTQIDVGFGDAVQPEPRIGAFPTVLQAIDPPVLRMYPPEVVIAEKLHAMVVLDISNSRMKDFYDLWYLARTQSFDLETLRGAIDATFHRRRTPVPTEIPFALTDRFLEHITKTQQWGGFLRRLQLESDTPNLQDVRALIAQFAGPVFTAGRLARIWRAGGAWHD